MTGIAMDGCCFLWPWLFRLFTVGFLIGILTMAGCYQRSIAPPVEYNKKDVKLLEKELKQMDWD